MRARPGWQEVNAVKNDQLFEIKSAEILQPGPASITEGQALALARSVLATLPADQE